MATMKAVQMHAFGDVDVLHYEEIERPLPQAGEVLVRVRAAGINPVEYHRSRGSASALYPGLGSRR